jgi:hypothetical protein
MAESHGDEIDSIKDTLEDIKDRLSSVELRSDNHEPENENELKQFHEDMDYYRKTFRERIEKCEKAIEQFAKNESNPTTKPTAQYIDPAKVAALINNGSAVRMKLTLYHTENDSTIDKENYVSLLSNYCVKHGDCYSFYDTERKCTLREVSPRHRHILEAYELKEIPIS